MSIEEEVNPTWEGKTEWPIGYPVDPADLPVLLYQCIFGAVYTRLTWRDGSTSRGISTIDELAALVGSTPRDGWYDQNGKYLGSEPN